MGNSPALIQIRDLRKNFGTSTALDGLELNVEHGQVHGFLGPNGSGKSTTIRIILGLLRSSGGDVTVFGRDPWKDASALHQRIAYVPGDVSLWPNLSGGEAIDLLSRLRRGASNKKDYRERKDRLLAAFEFDPSKKGRSYSKGNRQKVALIAALATPAQLYVLDEPTSGLDPIMETVFNQEIERVAGDGATVLFSSHILSEVERLCDRVTIIRQGKTVETGTLDQLRGLTRSDVSFGVGEAPSVITEAMAKLRHTPGVQDLALETTGAESARIKFTAESQHMAGVLPLLAQLNAQALTITPPSLEDLFLRHYTLELAHDGVKQDGFTKDGFTNNGLQAAGQ
ncbi:ABC transporter ATP-binding protein [Pseudarthrobacter sp. J1738]|uniref:ABC transporter ATP-binding protein n=1 Tax=unclassified Pseudarthrobacter TaxID=2647000 RepID=UPI003D2D73D0